MSHALALQSGTVLAEDYRIERVLGAGGFGITYLADEMALQRLVTIKEYFPADFATRDGTQNAMPRSVSSVSDYQWGLDRFIEEAQTLARFDHRNIVRVYRYFRANNTGYMVLQFEEGRSLKGWLSALGRSPRQRELDQIIGPLLDALEIIHAADFLHRDIAPDNIIIRKDGSPVLIDFGSARGEIAKHTRTLSALVKPGYSPYEQYSETGRQQGPWTDIYALGATLYHIISGKRPPDAPGRIVKDDLAPAHEVALSSYRPRFLRAIDRALALDIDRRPQSVAAWRGDLLAPEPASARGGWLKRSQPRAQIEPSLEPAHSPLPAALAAVVPPAPDAPGRHGGFLDFVDNLKPKPTGPRSQPPAAAAPSLAAAPMPLPAPGLVASPAVEMPPPSPPTKRRSEPRSPSERERRGSPKPRAIRSERRMWRSVLFKLGVGAAVAAAVVSMQDTTPSREVRSQSAVSSEAVPDVPLAVRLAGHRGGTTGVAYTDDGRSVVTAGADGTVRVWLAATGVLQRTIELDHGPATSLAVSGYRAATGHADGTIALWDLDRAERLATFKRNEASVWAVSFAGGPNRIAAATHDWAVSLWETRQAASLLHVFEGHEGAAQSVAFSTTRGLVASGGADRIVRLWNVQSLSPVRSYRGHRDFVTGLAFSANGRVLASAGLDGSIRLWSTTSSRTWRVLSGHRGRISSIAFSPVDELLASGGDDGAVRLWDHKRGRQVRTFGNGGGAIRSVAFAPDGQRLAAAGEDGTVRIWNVSVPGRTARWHPGSGG